MAIHPLSLDEASPGTSWRKELYPSLGELVLLQLLNRFRMDPQGEAERIQPQGKRIRIPGLSHPIDWQMFREEMSSFVPLEPVLPHPALQEAARSHAAYCAQHQLVGHGQRLDDAGFTGVAPRTVRRTSDGDMAQSPRM